MTTPEKPARLDEAAVASNTWDARLARCTDAFKREHARHRETTATLAAAVEENNALTKRAETAEGAAMSMSLANRGLLERAEKAERDLAEAMRVMHHLPVAGEGER